MNKALIDLTDDELKEGLRQKAESTNFFYNDYYHEIQRRSQDRNSKAIVGLTWATVLIAAVATIIAVFK